MNKYRFHLCVTSRYVRFETFSDVTLHKVVNIFVDVIKDFLLNLFQFIELPGALRLTWNLIKNNKNRTFWRFQNANGWTSEAAFSATSTKTNGTSRTNETTVSLTLNVLCPKNNNSRGHIFLYAPIIPRHILTSSQPPRHYKTHVFFKIRHFIWIIFQQ